MTSPAIKLARECGLIGEWTPGYKQYGVFPLHLTSEHVEQLLSAYYIKAQAQVLRDAAETLRCDFRDFDAATLYRMAAELERGA